MSVVGLAHWAGQWVVAHRNGQVQGASLKLETALIGLVSLDQGWWAWGEDTVIDQAGRRFPCAPGHTLVQRSENVWTASDDEVCRYQWDGQGWQLMARFTQLPGPCLGFDVSSQQNLFLRIWPGQGNRMHVGIYGADGTLIHMFKRGSLNLQAAFSWDERNLLVTGWQPHQLTVWGLSGGETSLRKTVGVTGWLGPIFRVDQRLVVVCQGGIQTYWGPREEQEYFQCSGYEHSHPWVVADSPTRPPYRWDPRYANRNGVTYHRCPVTAVGSHADVVALGNRDGSVHFHRVRENVLLHTPVRAVGVGDAELLILEPQHNRLARLNLDTLHLEWSAPLPLGTFWPGERWWWGHLNRDENRLYLLDRYALQCVDWRQAKVLWKQERPRNHDCSGLIVENSGFWINDTFFEGATGLPGDAQGPPPRPRVSVPLCGGKGHGSPVVGAARGKSGVVSWDEAGWVRFTRLDQATSVPG